jgi:tetratricopeptide (TPR) repeat protein
LQGAKDAFEEALEIQRETLRTSPVADEEEIGVSSNQALLSIASTLCNLGSIQLRWGDFEEARVALEEALLVSYAVVRLCVQAILVAFILTESRLVALLDSTICVGR